VTYQKAIGDKVQGGSALFLILIAVVLFAALTYAITQSNRGNAVSMSREIADNRAAELIDYAMQIRYAVRKLVLIGCDVSQINVSATGIPANSRCYVFSPNGGGVAHRVFSNDYLNMATASNNSNWWGSIGMVSFNPNNRVQNMGSDNQGVNSVDLLGMFVSIHPEICKAINRRYAIVNPPGTTVWLGYTTGGNLPGLLNNHLITLSPELGKKGAGCFYQSNYGGSNDFYFSILEN
jgi:hypothetical protein